MGRALEIDFENDEFAGTPPSHGRQYRLEHAGRQAETTRTWVRSDRIFVVDENSWYFRTREGIEIGPYRSRFEAEVEAGLLREVLRNLDGSKSALAAIQEFVVESFENRERCAYQVEHISLVAPTDWQASV